VALGVLPLKRQQRELVMETFTFWHYIRIPCALLGDEVT